MDVVLESNGETELQGSEDHLVGFSVAVGAVLCVQQLLSLGDVGLDDNRVSTGRVCSIATKTSALEPTHYHGSRFIPWGDDVVDGLL